jgi:hypothetical protein
MTDQTTGERFAHAIAKKDRSGLAALLADDVDFLALTPRRMWEAHTPDEVVEVVFGSWFEDHDQIDAMTHCASGEPVADRKHVAYRFDMTTPDGPRVAEQQAYYAETDGKLSYLRIMCSGFRPR